MSRTTHPPTDHAVLVRGFAVILHASEYLDLITRHAALHLGDYGTYLADLYSRMRAARHTGKRVLVGPFLTDQYESYAEAIGEAAESRHALRAYDDFVARASPHTREWNGEPISHVVVSLRAATDTRADQAKIFSLLKQAADRYPDPQRVARDALIAATEIFTPLLKRAEPGHHTLTCTLRLACDHFTYALPVVRTPELIAFPDGSPEQVLCAALATAQLTGCPATLVLCSRRLAVHARSQEPDDSADHGDQLTIRVWRLSAGRAIPLTAPQAFDLAYTNPASNHPIPPEPGAHYADAFPLTGQPP